MSSNQHSKITYAYCLNSQAILLVHLPPSSSSRVSSLAEVCCAVLGTNPQCPHISSEFVIYTRTSQRVPLQRVSLSGNVLDMAKFQWYMHVIPSSLTVGLEQSDSEFWAGLAFGWYILVAASCIHMTVTLTSYSHIECIMLQVWTMPTGD